MNGNLTSLIAESLSLSWLTGPIFDKELRVSSRRRRNYVLRFVYMAMLTAFLTLVWLQTVHYRGSLAYRMSRMSVAGQQIISFIVLFQFIAIQIVSVVMLSTSISDEIYNRTLGVLMTTPINSFQIVMGKLLSKLLQLILLLAISLPLLAIVRVFGGVPWGYVVSSLCITLTTAICFGSISLFFSIFRRKAYSAIITTVLTVAVIFAIAPLLGALIMVVTDLDRGISGRTLFAILFHVNPYVALSVVTQQMMLPRSTVGMGAMYWPFHCLTMLAASGILLAISVSMVRKVALRQATGQLIAGPKKSKRGKAPAGSAEEPDDLDPPQRVCGPPVLWKELKKPIFKRRKKRSIITISIAVILLFVTYALFGAEDVLGEGEVHVMYLIMFLALGMLFTIVAPATCITTEKESRSWPILLGTTLSRGEILLGKIGGLMPRCLPIWLFLIGHVLLFVLGGIIHPLAILHIVMIVAGVIAMFVGTGLYFSTRFKRTTTAVVMNFVLPLVIWGLVPLFMTLITAINNGSGDVVEGYCASIPFVQAGVSIYGGSRNHGHYQTHFQWPHGDENAAITTRLIFLFMMINVAIGVAFAMRAKYRLRQSIF
ncbi:MAG: ABC transporter permease subunit [Planctomycetes bacterium]|nr:ABC transporter permease subunit [Planctomycetota bacterium]